MRLNKLAKKIFAAGLAVSLMMANAGMSFAYDTPATVNPISFDTTLTVSSADVKSPYAKVNYTITTDGIEDIAGTADNVEIKKGIGTPTIAAVEFQAGQSTEAGKREFVSSANIDFTGINFTDVGVYRYKITCALDNTSDPAVKIKDGEVTTKYLDVYIGDNNGTLECYGSVLHNDAAAPKRDGSTPGTDNKTGGLKLEYETTDLTVTKTVTGNQGSKNKEFPFVIELTGIKGTVYNVTINNTTSTATVGDDGKAKVEANLKDGGTIKIEGIGKTTKYSVTETPGDYTPSYTINGGTKVSEAATGEQTLSESATVAFTNNREGTVPTGVILDSAPFILIIGLAAAALIFTAARKKVR